MSNLEQAEALVKHQSMLLRRLKVSFWAVLLFAAGTILLLFIGKYKLSYIPCSLAVLLNIHVQWLNVRIQNIHREVMKLLYK